MNRVLFWQRLGVIVCFVSIFQCVTIPKFFELGIFFCQLHWHCYSFQGPKKSTWLSIFVFPQAILAQVFGLFQTPAINTYGLLTKCEIKMAGYWPSSFFACLWTSTPSRSINSQKTSHPDRTSLVNKEFIIWLSGKFFLRDTAGSPERAR